MSELIATLGGPTAVARMLGIKPPSVIGWRGRIPAERCPDLERAVAGKLTCEVMRGDVMWVRVPDPTWPHPAGRPCLDPAGPPTECACFDGACRGGEVVNGKLASGQICKRAAAESNAAAA